MKKLDLMVILKNHVPMSNWIVNYSTKDAFGDLLAGLTVGLTLIPQAIAYASLAGLGPQYGLYSSFAGSFVYIILGTCKEVNIGPAAIISLLTYTYARGIPEYAILLCFLSGCITVLLGISRLSFLMNFVSSPVVGGLTSAASIIIASSQIKGLLGLSFQSSDFIEFWTKLVNHIQETRLSDSILSGCCIAVLLFLKQIKDVDFSNKSINRIFWFIGTARNAIVVILTTIIAYSIPEKFLLTGHIDTGLPVPKFPDVSYDNGSYMLNFLGMCKEIGNGLIVVPLVSIIGNIAIAKAFSQGKILNATQEILALGFCNVVGSFFQSMPVSGSFSRSAVNNASGVRTPFGGLYTGILVILSLSVLTPYFYFIPKATLSSVIICAVIFMIEFKKLKLIWICNKRDLIPFNVTFAACLGLGIERGILVGVVLDITLLAFMNARPKIIIEDKQTSSDHYVLVRFSSGLLYPAMDYLRSKISNYVLQKQNAKTDNNLKYLILDFHNIDKIDFTAAQGIQSLIKDLNKANYQVTFINVEPNILITIQTLTPIVTINSLQDFENEHINCPKKTMCEISTSF